jgi:hypothetical protein
MTVTEPAQRPTEPSPPEALIAEAREVQRRRRRRRLTTFGVGGVLAAAAVVLLIRIVSDPASVPGGARATLKLRASVVPKDPTTLATGPGGALYIADPGRQQILKRLTSGRFEVVAGTGAAGDTGDGGLATRARIDIGYDAGMAVTPTGILYFVQTGAAGQRNVVRKVTPDGKITTVAITTVAGLPTATSSDPVCREPGSSLRNVTAKDLSASTLAIAPNGDLAILASACPRSSSTHQVLLDLTHGGKLVVAPDSSIVAQANSGRCGYGLAYSAGVLYASCSYGSPHPHSQPDAFLIVGPHGRANRLPALYYGETSSPRALASAPGGGVVAIDFYSIVRVTPQGVRKLIDLSQNRSLGTYIGVDGQRHPYSMDSQGVAVDRAGDIYLASTSDYSNGGIDFTGIVELHANGRIQVLWTRR